MPGNARKCPEMPGNLLKKNRWANVSSESTSLSVFLCETSKQQIFNSCIDHNSLVWWSLGGVLGFAHLDPMGI